MARFMLEIALDNDSFSGTQCGGEVARILFSLGHLVQLNPDLMKLATACNGRKIVDSNGNHVGNIAVTGTGTRGRRRRPHEKPVIIAIHKIDGTCSYEEYTVLAVAGRAWKYASKGSYGRLARVKRSEYWLGDPRIEHSGARLIKAFDNPAHIGK